MRDGTGSECGGSGCVCARVVTRLKASKLGLWEWVMEGGECEMKILRIILGLVSLVVMLCCVGCAATGSSSRASSLVHSENDAQRWAAKIGPAAKF